MPWGNNNINFISCILAGLTPLLLAAGLRYLLTDDELDICQSVMGSAPVTLTAEQDDLTGTLSASLLFNGGEKISSELAYDGEYGDDTTLHSVWVRFNFML